MNRASVVYALALIAALATPAAAIMVELPVEQVVSLSDAVVRGRVIELNSYLLENPRVIRTDVTLEVAEAWVGPMQAGSRIVVQLQGGRVGDLVQQVEHQPDLRPDDDVVLFLTTSPSARHVITADVQGKYDVVGDQIMNLKRELLDLSAFRSRVRQQARMLGR